MQSLGVKGRGRTGLWMYSWKNGISIQFSLFPAHINISYSNNVYILCRKRGGQKTMLIHTIIAIPATPDDGKSLRRKKNTFNYKTKWESLNGTEPNENIKQSSGLSFP